MNEIVDINLLPSKARRKRLSREGKQILFIGITVVLLLVGIYASNVYTKIQRTNYLDSVNAQIDALKNVQKILDERAALSGDLLYYETTIPSLTGQQAVWNDLIDELALFMPKDAVLDSIEFDRKTNLVKITGYALDFQKLAWTFNALSQNENFMQLTLEDYSIPFPKESELAKDKEKGYPTFTISFQWKGMMK